MQYKLAINFNTSVGRLKTEIYSADGKKVYDINQQSAQRFIINFDYPEGIYFVRVISEEINFTRMIIKK